MKRYFFLITLLCGFALQATANGQPGSAVWERDAALAAINPRVIDTAVAEIGDASSLGDAPATLDRLLRLETRSDWPLPMREAVLYRFTRSLAGLPRDAVAEPVMQYLHLYQARTLVPLEERPGAYVPLFNIRGAAGGVENGWSRTEATAQAVPLLDKQPAKLLDAYLQAPDGPQRQGYLDAVELAQRDAVFSLQDAAMQRLANQPGLTALLIATSAITHDRQAMQAVLINGRGAGLVPAFTGFGRRLQDDELADLLGFAIHKAPASNASLAIAAWWPRLRHEAATRDLLIGLLDDAELGSSAVLALSQAPDVQTIKLLQDAAGSGSGAAARAQQALDLSRTHPRAGLQP